MTELRTAFDAASAAHSSQVSVKDGIKNELDGLEKLFSADLNGGLSSTDSVMYGLWGQCFDKSHAQYQYKHCWMDRVEQSGTLLGKFSRFSQANGRIVMHYQGKCGLFFWHQSFWHTKF